MSAFRRFDPYAVIPGLGGAPPKAAKVSKVATPASWAAVTLGGLGTLGGLSANIANPSSSLSAAHAEINVDHLGHNQSCPSTDTPASVPADWVAGSARLSGMSCPTTVEAKRWLQLQTDARCFVDQWSIQAAALGWSTLDVFGCDPVHPADRHDRGGLAWMIGGSNMQAISQEVAILRYSSGLLQRVRKCPVIRGRVLAWEL